MLNLLWFQLGWWTLVITATYGLEWLGILVTIFLVAFHFQFISTNKKRDLLLLIPVASLGISGDFLLVRMGVFKMPDPNDFFPLWLMGMWFLFPLTLPYSMAPLMQKKWLVPLLALAAGFSYYAGTAFKILFTNEPVIQNLLIASLAWLIYLTSFNNIQKKIKA